MVLIVDVLLAMLLDDLTAVLTVGDYHIFCSGTPQPKVKTFIKEPTGILLVQEWPT